MRKRKFRIANKAIVLMKLLSGVGLFFSCCLFFFTNVTIFRHDLGFDQNAPLGSASNPWLNIIFPIVFFVGLSFIGLYIINLLVRIETKELWKADRLFFVYQIVFNAILISTIWRWFFISITNALLPSVIMLVSGFINLITPKIVDNDNLDF